MKQRFPVETSSRSSQNQFLSPALQVALANLDVQLDEELARYRRQRAKRSSANAIPSFREAASKNLDLIAIGAIGGRTQPQEAVPSPERSPSALPAASNSRDFASVAPQTPWLADTNAPAFLAVTPETGRSSQVASEVSSLAPYSTEPDISALAQSTDLGPDDYLESSEELLRSLAEEEAQVRAERGFVQSLLTPVGVGSLLLLLLSSATFGYLIMNPSSLGYLSQGRSDSSQNGTVASQSGVAGSNGANSAPYAVNLAEQELQSLNLDNLSLSNTGDRTTLSSTLTSPAKSKVPGSPPSAKTTPKLTPSSSTTSATRSTANPSQARGAIAPAPALPSTSRSAPAPLAPAPVAPARPYNPAPPRRSAPAPQTVLPAPRVAVPAPAPVAPAAATSNSSYRYKVVIPYDGDRTLETVKQSVPDAYVRNLPDGGAVIQGGAFSSEQEAQQRVQQLQNQGLPAEMRQQ